MALPPPSRPVPWPTPTHGILNPGRVYGT
jgi:hypothetical protein